jgi:hypothetical protein
MQKILSHNTPWCAGGELHRYSAIYFPCLQHHRTCTDTGTLFVLRTVANRDGTEQILTPLNLEAMRHCFFVHQFGFCTITGTQA